jgi:hypothetical protein
MTSKELLLIVEELRSDLDRLNASHQQLYEDSVRVLEISRNLLASKLEQTQPSTSIKEMEETQMSFNLQYLQLQSQMQKENRAYTAVSNIMKTKHDTVKNSINNVK